MPMPSEREKLARNIEGLKENIQLAWHDMLSKPMTAGERQELRDNIESLVGELNRLHTKLDQLPGPGVASHR
jgi:flagellar hook-associated protein FlgK